MRNVITAVILVVLPVVSFAQGNSGRRADTWEWSVSGIFQESKSSNGQGGSSLDVDSATGFGINFAYNYTSKLSLGGDFEFIRPDYEALIVDDTGVNDDILIKHRMTQWNARLKGTFNVIDGPFTPFLEAGIGWSFFDSNVTDGQPIIGCWWHPLWGYICDGYYRTYGEDMFSYGVGAGLRYQFRGGSFVKASYNLWELDGLGKGVDSSFGAGRLEFGWSF